MGVQAGQKKLDMFTSFNVTKSIPRIGGIPNVYQFGVRGWNRKEPSILIDWAGPKDLMTTEL